MPVGPTTTKRSMETTTIAQDGQTLVIGGLVRDNFILNERKVPLLGDIPILGWLFRSQTRSVEKLNLLVFLTPTLVKNETDMVELNRRKSIELGTIQRENRIEEPTKLKQETTEKLDHPPATPQSNPSETPSPTPRPSTE